MPRYVNRDESGKIKSSFAVAQHAGQERLDDTDAELIAFQNPSEPPPPVTMAETLDAMKQIANAAGLTTSQKSKMTALITRLA